MATMATKCNYCGDEFTPKNLTKIGKNVFACNKCKKTLTTCPTCKSESVSNGICLVCGDTFDPNYYNKKPYVQNNFLKMLCNCGEIARNNGIMLFIENAIYAEIYCTNCDKTHYQLLIF